MTDDRTGVLIADDEEPLRRLYESWLREYDTYVADSGDAALDVLEAHHDAITVALLDRDMPGLSGEELLAVIRERGYDCRVALVTAISPTFDIVGMPFDDYLTKPLDADDINEAVADLRERATRDPTRREWDSLRSKRASLEAEWSRTELDGSEEYRQLQERIETLRQRLAETNGRDPTE